MKVAVTSKEASADSRIDPRFGRAGYIIVIDTDTGDTQIHDNQVNVEAAQGAGIQTAQNVVRFGAQAVVTGHLGPNAFRALSAAGIKAYLGFEGTVQQAVEKLKAGELTPSDSPDVEGHWV